MADYKVRIEMWCDWDPAEGDLEEFASNISAGEANCTKREILNVGIARKILRMTKP